MAYINGRKILFSANVNISEGGGGSYEQGFADGRASVKHISFAVYVEWDYIDCCAFEGMTWREMVERKINPSFSISGNKVKYNGDYTIIDVTPDDIIVDNALYEVLPPPEYWRLYFEYDWEPLYRTPEAGIEPFVNSEYNTLGLYIDDDGYLRTPKDEYVYCGLLGDEDWFIDPDCGATNVNNDYGFYSCNDFIAEARKADCYADIDGYHSIQFASGMTWRELVDSKFADAISIYENEIYHDYGNWRGLILNGEDVKPDDVIVDGATYYCGGY